MFDVPRCLPADAFYVGDPSVRSPQTRGWRAPWGEAMRSGGTMPFRQRVVQECLDTVGVLRNYREPQEGETWMLPADSEQRLLAQINAIVGLGAPALDQVASLAIDPDLPDPGRVFAALFALGCVEGQRWLPTVQRIFAAVVLRHPQEAAAAVEALCLSPHTEVERLLKPLLVNDFQKLRAASTRVLAYRGTLSEVDWARAMRDEDAGVVAAALAAPLQKYDESLCERLLQGVFDLEHEPLARAALRAGAGRRLSSIHGQAVRIVSHDPAWADALYAMALHGDPADVPRLRVLFDGPYRWHAVRAAAALGSAALVPDLLRLLDDAKRTPDDAQALHKSLHAIAGLPAGDAKAMKQSWAQRSAGFREDLRYRGGQVLDAQRLLQLLKAPPGSRAARQDLYLELLALTRGCAPRFSPYDFVGVQQASLRQIEHWLAEVGTHRVAVPALQ